MRELASQRGKGFGDRRGGRGNRVENRKKILNRGNELNDLLETIDLAVFRAKNELKTNPKRTCFFAQKARIKAKEQDRIDVLKSQLEEWPPGN